MSEEGGRPVRPVRLLLIIALLAINGVLVVLNLQKQELFPFDSQPAGSGVDAAGSGGTAEPDDSVTESGTTAPDGPAGESTDPAGGATAAGDSAGVADAGAASTTAATGGQAADAGGAGADADAGIGADLGVDDWPGGRGPVPAEPPVPRRAVLNADGTMVLSGSVASWAVATAIADVAADRLEQGIDGVTIDYSWHPAAPAGTTGGRVAVDPVVLYQAGQVAVPAEALPVLDGVAEVLDGDPVVLAVVTAHVDDLGGTDENLTVAAARATAVAGYLESLGIDRSRTVIAIAPEDPGAAADQTEEERTFNRRVEIDLENFLGPPTVG
ncbi:MAG: OmpA family protein [Acidimicrobiales bacterium]